MRRMRAAHEIEMSFSFAGRGSMPAMARSLSCEAP